MGLSYRYPSLKFAVEIIFAVARSAVAEESSLDCHQRQFVAAELAKWKILDSDRDKTAVTFVVH